MFPAWKDAMLCGKVQQMMQKEQMSCSVATYGWSQWCTLEAV